MSKETRPLFIVDALAGRGMAGNTNYIIGNAANINKISFECRNDIGNAVLERKRANPPEGYVWDKFVFPESYGGVGYKIIEWCAGDFPITGRIERRANLYRRQYDRNNKSQCCLGKFNPTTATRLCDPAWKFNSEECDGEAKAWCETNPLDPVCGCLMPQSYYESTKLLGPPECIDARCAGNPKAYKTQTMQKRICPNIVNCVIDKTVIENIENSNISGLHYEQNCGMTLEDAKKKLLEAEEAEKNKEGPEGTPEGTTSESFKFKDNTLIFGGIGIALLLFGGSIIAFSGKDEE